MALWLLLAAHVDRRYLQLPLMKQDVNRDVSVSHWLHRRQGHLLNCFLPHLLHHCHFEQSLFRMAFRTRYLSGLRMAFRTRYLSGLRMIEGGYFDLGVNRDIFLDEIYRVAVLLGRILAVVLEMHRGKESGEGYIIISGDTQIVKLEFLDRIEPFDLRKLL